jgi:hypothetical protein
LKSSARSLDSNIERHRHNLREEANRKRVARDHQIGGIVAGAFLSVIGIGIPMLIHHLGEHARLNNEAEGSFSSMRNNKVYCYFQPDIIT